MKTVPMIFNTEMVTALLNGSKAVTRRPIRIPDGWELYDSKLSKITSSHPKKGKWGALVRRGVGTDFPQCDLVTAPCFIGDLIWVRETFATLHPGQDYEEISPWEVGCQEVRYKASEPTGLANEKDHEIRGYKWRPSIHMPKHCSRLTLRVTDVRIEKLKDLRGNPEQVQKEGFRNWPMFKHTWRSIYGTCEPNDHVWAIEFEVIEKNVDKLTSCIDEAA
ncbi:hypothetical protein [Vibrio sp. H11]|uniref:hypothetical protein n=1 Tax=Vibrio sp. H11 TaxID=2565928 RepID=UPI0010A64B0C|nr:hypothetical protein [Vibrio sp. H11]